MEQRITVVGLDAHKVSTNVAILLSGAVRPIEWQVSTERSSIRKMVKKVWLRSLDFEHTADRVVLQEYLLTIEQVEEKLRGLDGHIESAS